MNPMRILPTGLLAATLLSCLFSCQKQKENTPAQPDDRDRELAELRQLAELDRREMENQYAEFASQYDEMKRTVRDDSLMARLDAEQKRAERLLKELRETKSQNAAEIVRLKKELETVRSVLRDYVRQVDSLQRLNVTLVSERDAARSDAERTRQENSDLSAKNQNLTERVAIAAQLNATGISVTPLKKNGKPAKKTKDVKNFQVDFTITRNVTAQAGRRTVYVRLLKPNQTVLNAAGTFAYENRTIEFSASKGIEYGGQELRQTLYVPVAEFIGPGTFRAYIFCDGQMIGSGTVTMEK